MGVSYNSGRKKKKPSGGKTVKKSVLNKKASSKKKKESIWDTKPKKAKPRPGPSVLVKMRTPDFVMQKIREAANDLKLLEITYRDSKAKHSRRRIEPYSLRFEPDNCVKLYGFCLMRQEIRCFKFSNILDIYILTETFNPRYDVTVEKNYYEHNIV